MNEYLIWYRKTGGDVDIVVAASRNYETARKRALQLWFSLDHWHGVKAYQIGVTRLELNSLEVKMHDLNFPTRWVVVENGVEIPEEE